MAGQSGCSTVCWARSMSFCHTTNISIRSARRTDAHVEWLRTSGRRPSVIPLGGATVEGALGYVVAVDELAEQWSRLERPRQITSSRGWRGTRA